MMYKALKNLYLRGRINDAGLDAAVSDGLITQAQADEIKAAATQ